MSESTTDAICYADGKTLVRLGDNVEFSVWFPFIRRKGVVVYLPGVSKLRTQFEHNGLRWIAVKVEGKNRSITAVGILIDPDTNLVKRSCIFKGRSKDHEPFDIEEICDDEW